MDEDQVLTASGGWCAPVTPLYDLWRQPWETPDGQWQDARYENIDVETWLFPRWARAERALGEARYRLEAALAVLRNGVPNRGEDWD